ncbi:MAG TPA: BMP family ABC transporter substrate-binding protein, partial [Anaerolineae bacterium]|nr:BMP family ABC transporter substrate-binding protein [Anaerolineae bacterium]
MRKSFWLVALFLILGFGLAACSTGGGSTEEEAAPAETGGEEEAMPAEEEAMPAEEEAPAEEAAGDCASEDVFCVGLVTDAGEIDGKSFNQSAWEGVQ